jgi:hypothetical protein
MNKAQLTKIHKLYKDIKKIELEGGFINVIIQLPLKDLFINDLMLGVVIGNVLKVRLKLFSFTLFKDELYISFEVI